MSDDTKEIAGRESSGDRRRQENNEAARRADYERLAESFLRMYELEAERVTPRLDVESLTEDESDHVLWNAINTHLRMTFNMIDWVTPDGMRLYVEMRLLADRHNQRLIEARESDEREAAESEATP